MDQTHSELLERWASNERLRLTDAERTPQTHTTPGEVSVQGACTLTDEEREAIAWFAIYADTPGEERQAIVLAKLLERTK